jgi:hypothetical protein
LDEADLSLDEMHVRRSERRERTNTFGQMQKAPYPARYERHIVGKKSRRTASHVEATP